MKDAEAASKIAARQRLKGKGSYVFSSFVDSTTAARAAAVSLIESEVFAGFISAAVLHLTTYEDQGFTPTGNS